MRKPPNNTAANSRAITAPTVAASGKCFQKPAREASLFTNDSARYEDRWVHLRPSGTEPIVRVIAEGPTEHDARTLIRQAREPLSALGSL